MAHLLFLPQASKSLPQGLCRAIPSACRHSPRHPQGSNLSGPGLTGSVTPPDSPVHTGNTSPRPEPPPCCTCPLVAFTTFSHPLPHISCQSRGPTRAGIWVLFADVHSEKRLAPGRAQRRARGEKSCHSPRSASRGRKSVKPPAGVSVPRVSRDGPRKKPVPPPPSRGPESGVCSRAGRVVLIFLQSSVR